MNEYTLTAIGIACILIIKITCFILGYKTVKLGYQLMKDGIKGEFNFSAGYNGIKGGLVSSSPGLLFLLLGILLIGYAIWVKKPVSLEGDEPVNKEQVSGKNDKNGQTGKRELPYEQKGHVKDSL